MSEDITPETDEAPQGKFLSGELHVIANADTGAISVSAPFNDIIALGLLEMARIAITDRHHEQMRKQAQTAAILRATPGDISKVASGLVRPV